MMSSWNVEMTRTREGEAGRPRKAKIHARPAGVKPLEVEQGRGTIAG
jgi:hypothetical protein